MEIRWSGFVVAYTASPQPGMASTRTSSDVLAARYDINGTFLGCTEVATTWVNEYQPSIGMDWNGNFAVAYTSGGSPNMTVHINQFTSAGAGTTGSVPLDFHAPTARMSDPSIAVSDSGRVTVLAARGTNPVSLSAGGGVTQRLQISPFRVEVDRSAAHFHFEGGDAVVVAHALCFVDHGGGFVEAEHVADAHAVGVAAEEFGHREVEGASEGVPEGHVEGGFGGGVADGAGEVVEDGFSL